MRKEKKKKQKMMSKHRVGVESSNSGVDPRKRMSYWKKTTTHHAFVSEKYKQKLHQSSKALTAVVGYLGGLFDWNMIG